MRTIAFDCETWPIHPALKAPRMVCLSHSDGVCKSALLGRADGLRWLKNTLQDPDVVWVGANTSYDVGATMEADPTLIPLWFRAYEEDRVRDVLIRQRLINLALGEIDYVFDPAINANRKQVYSLAALVKRLMGIDISESKNNPDAWRLRYNELDGRPVSDWPEAAYQYALNDAVYTRAVYTEQWAGTAAPFAPDFGVVNEGPQTRYALALHLSGVWGAVTDKPAVETLRSKLLADVGDIDRRLKEVGIMRPNGKKDLKTLRDMVSEAYGGDPPLTKKGSVATSGAALRGSGVPLLEEMGATTGPKHHLTHFIPRIESGRINPGYDVVKSTGRVSSRGPSVHNMPKSGGFRECITARPGRVLLGSDYDQLELCALAQVCLTLFGFSKMAEAIRAGKDLHLVMAALTLGVPYSTVSKDTHPDERQRAKAANFGFPGGLGVDAFVQYALSYEVVLERDDAKEIKKEWLAAWPEMKLYFKYIGDITGRDRGDIVQHVSGRKRGGGCFTELCNTLFQGLAADGMGRATWLITQDCYNHTGSPLFGWRILAVVHDEVLLEGPGGPGLDEAAARLQTLLIEGMAAYIPDVPISTEPAAMLRWSKKAETIRDPAGCLQIWKEEEKNG